MGPIQYNLTDPSAAMLNGLKFGAFMNEAQAEQQKQALAQQAALQQAADLQALYTNPNAGHAEYAAVMTKYPGMAENIGKAYKVLDEGKQRTALEFSSRVYGALASGNTDLAVQMMKERAKADPAQAQSLNTLAQVAEADPRAGRMMWASTLSGMLGPDKFATAFPALMGEQRAQDKAPAELRKAEADATMAEVGIPKAVADAEKARSEATIKAEEAKAAPQKVAMDLEKLGWDIKALQNDIAFKKEQNRIAAMNAAANREGNDLKRQELRLKIQEAEGKLADGIRAKAADVESARTGMDNMLNTVDRLLQNKSLNNVVGSIEGRLPAVFSDEAADAIALSEAVKSQAFMAQVPTMKGLGALSNAEGDKLQASLQNLTRAQSEKQFRASLEEAQRLILKGRKNLVTRYGVPDTVPDTPAAGVNPGEIDALLKKYGGK